MSDRSSAAKKAWATRRAHGGVANRQHQRLGVPRAVGPKPGRPKMPPIQYLDAKGQRMSSAAVVSLKRKIAALEAAGYRSFPRK